MKTLVAPGTAIAVIAPSGAYDADRLERGLAVARAAGHVLVPFPDMLQPERYLANSDSKRLAHLVYALTKKRFAAIWLVRGGYGITRLLHRIPWDQVVPKPIIGFSDATPLLEAMRQRFDVPMVHGPVLNSLADTGPAARAHLFDLLSGLATRPLTGTVWHKGTADGPLVGGNLAMLAATCGTPFQVRPKGGILLLEDIAEPPYRVDRMLQQLRSAGVFDEVAGVALGSFTRCDPPADATWSLADVLHDHLDPLGVPVLADLPFGHDITHNHALPIGVRARIEAGILHWDTGHLT